MKTRLVNKWVDALRSGEYKQGKGQLKTSEEDGATKHCCLGVAKEVFNLEEADGGSLRGSYEKLGLNFAHGDLIIPGCSIDIELVVLNDSYHFDAYDQRVSEPLTFDEIADVILISHWEGWLGPKGVGV